jgi:hypothetical protein
MEFRDTNCERADFLVHLDLAQRAGRELSDATRTELSERLASMKLPNNDLKRANNDFTTRANSWVSSAIRRALGEELSPDEALELDEVLRGIYAGREYLQRDREATDRAAAVAVVKAGGYSRVNLRQPLLADYAAVGNYVSPAIEPLVGSAMDAQVVAPQPFEPLRIEYSDYGAPGRPVLVDRGDRVELVGARDASSRSALALISRAKWGRLQPRMSAQSRAAELAGTPLPGADEEETGSGFMGAASAMGLSLGVKVGTQPPPPPPGPTATPEVMAVWKVAMEAWDATPPSERASDPELVMLAERVQAAQERAARDADRALDDVGPRESSRASGGMKSPRPV